MDKPELKITVYSDYICPFCYVGTHRLLHLRDSYDIKINWCFLEIHPEIFAAGQAIDSLGYSPAQWQQMMNKLQIIAQQENIPLIEPRFITSSRDALLLAEAAKQCGAEIFYKLHEKLFSTYFVAGKNIGNRDTLNEIAAACGIDTKLTASAWNDNKYQQRLLDNYRSARTHNIQAVPGFIFGSRKLTGVVAESTFRDAARNMLGNS